MTELQIDSMLETFEAHFNDFLGEAQPRNEEELISFSEMFSAMFFELLQEGGVKLNPDKVKFLSKNCALIALNWFNKNIQ